MYPTIEPSFQLRWWRRAPWNRNVLMSGDVRLHGTIVIAMLLVLAGMVPIAAASGTARYVSLVERSQRSTSELHRVPATVMDDPRTVMHDPRTDAGGDRMRTATVSWTAASATAVDTATIEVSPQTVSGASVFVWLDGDGANHKAPASGTANAISATGFAITVWSSAALVAMLVIGASAWRLNSRRRVRWGADWTIENTSPDRP